MKINTNKNGPVTPHALICVKRMQALWDHLAEEHDFFLLESETQEIERIIYPEQYQANEG